MPSTCAMMNEGVQSDGRPSTRKGPSAVGKSRKASWKGQLNQSRKIRSLVTPAVPSVSQGSESTHLRNTEAEDPK